MVTFLQAVAKKAVRTTFTVVIVDIGLAVPIEAGIDSVTAQGLALGYNGAAISDRSRLRAVVLADDEA